MAVSTFASHSRVPCSVWFQGRLDLLLPDNTTIFSHPGADSPLSDIRAHLALGWQRALYHSFLWLPLPTLPPPSSDLCPARCKNPCVMALERKVPARCHGHSDSSVHIRYYPPSCPFPFVPV